MEEQSSVTAVTVASSSESFCPICYEEFHSDETTTTGNSESESESESKSESESNVMEVAGTEDKEVSPSSLSTATESPRTSPSDNGNPKRRRFQVEGCGHEFCHECLKEHCKFNIMNRNVPVPCPQVMPQEVDNDEEKNSKISFLQETSTSTTANSSTTSNSTTRHCLSSEMVRVILMVSPVTGAGQKTQEDSDKENLHNDNEKEEAAEMNEDLEEQSSFPEIQLSRTFSTQRMSSSSSSSSSSSTSSLPEYWKKYLRIQRLKEDPSLLSCPKCDELVTPPVPMDKSAEHGEQGLETTMHQHLVDDNIPFQDLENPGSLPINVDNHDVQGDNKNTSNEHDADDDDVQVLCYPHVACASCQHCFCAIHGDIHSGMSCAEFSNTERARDMDKSEQAIRAMTKRCSHDNCGAPVAKIAGCDHIICAHCHQDFCYKCGTHIYLKGKVIRSCSNCKQGFVDHRYYGQYRIRLLLILPLHLVLSAIYIAIVGVVAVLTCGFGCCFGCGTIEPQSSRAAGGSRKVNPGKGMFMTARVICMPIEELIRDCGFLRETGDDIRS